MVMPEISILFPVRNATRFLKETVASIQAQRFTSWELLAVNDASSDQSKEMLLNYAATDPRIRVFDNPGSGIISALQTAYAAAKGPYLTRMDADDLMPANRLGLMKQALEKSAPRTIITGLVQYFGDGTISAGYKTYEDWLNAVNLQGKQWQQVYRECVVASPNWMACRVEFEQFGSFTGLKYPEDYHLVFRWYRNGFHIQTIPEITLLWREHPDRISRNSTQYSQKAFFELKIGEFIEHDLRGGTLVIWGENAKSKLLKQIVRSRGIPFITMGMDNYQEIRSIKDPKLLVCVYPDETQRKAIQGYLLAGGVIEGRNWWYL